MKYIRSFNNYDNHEKLDESLKSLAMTGLITLSTIFGSPAKSSNYTDPFTPGITQTSGTFDINSDWKFYLIELSILLGLFLAVAGIAHLPSKDMKKLEDTYDGMKDELNNVEEPEDINRLRNDLNAAETKPEYIKCLDDMIDVAQEKGFEDIVDNLNKMKISIK